MPGGRPKGSQGSTQVPGALVKRYVRLPARKLSPKMLGRLVAARERQAKALDLRKAGVTYPDIAKALGYKTASGAKAAVESAIDRLGLEAAKDVVTLDLARLDEMQMQLTSRFRGGDMRLVGPILQVMQMRQNLLGITTDTYREEQAKAANVSVTNNALMVVNGSQSDYVRAMMSAVGMDVNSPDVQKYLASIEAGEQKTQTALPPGVGPSAQGVAHQGAAEGPVSADSSEPSGRSSYISGEVISSTIEEAIQIQDDILNRKARAAAPYRDGIDSMPSVPDIPALYVGSVDEE